MSRLPLEPLRVSRSSLSSFYIRRRRHASDYGDADRTLYRHLEARRAEIGEDFDIPSSDAHVRQRTLKVVRVASLRGGRHPSETSASQAQVVNALLFRISNTDE